MKSRYKWLTPLLLGVSLCLPLGLKLGIPLVLQQGENLGLFETLPGSGSPNDFYTVDGRQYCSDQVKFQYLCTVRMI
jgi:hypothetical protein